MSEQIDLSVTLEPDEYAVLARIGRTPGDYVALMLPIDGQIAFGKDELTGGVYLNLLTRIPADLLVDRSSKLFDASGRPVQQELVVLGLPPVLRLVVSQDALTESAKDALRESLRVSLENIPRES